MFFFALPTCLASSLDRSGVVFKEVGGKSLRLDLHYPSADPPQDGFPVVLFIHGGGWAKGTRVIGDKGVRFEAVKALNEHGFCVASTDYRLCTRDGRVVMRDCVVDCKDALRYLVLNKNQLSLDADHLFTMGDSAGGHLAQMVLLTDSDSFTGDSELAKVSVKPLAGVSWYGPGDFEKTDLFAIPGKTSANDRFADRILRKEVSEQERVAAYREVSPVNYLNADSSPLLVLQGDLDPTIPVHQAHELGRCAAKVEAPVVVKIIDGAVHNWKTSKGGLHPEFPNVVHETVSFMEKNLRPGSTAAREALRRKIKAVGNKVPKASKVLKPLTEYAGLTYRKTWSQLWDNEKRVRLRKAEEAIEVTGTVWSDAIEQSMKEQNGILIPEMPDILYLDRSIIVESGSRIKVHPKTELRMITDEVEFALIRNRSLVSGQEGPVVLCEGADRDILIEGGIWGDSKNSGYGPQGFREGKFGLMLGSQGCFVLSNVENVTVRNVCVRDYSSFGLQIGNARNFLIEGVCVDNTKDGVHVEGPAEFGVIRNIHGPRAGDDAVALNAWDWRTSSLTFGNITDILVEDSNVDEGACALRILPGFKLYPDGSKQECRVERCLFSRIRNIHSIKIYDQPNIRDVQNDYSADLGTVEDLYFENIHIRPFDLTHHRDESKNAVFELCSHAEGLFLDGIEMDYEPGEPNAELLMSVGPKTRIARIPFQKSGTQEIFNPKASPIARNISLRNIRNRAEGSQDSYLPHSKPRQLVQAISIKSGGSGKIEGSIKVYSTQPATKQ
ncbi:MAG: alpha/beta hydrolase fold domain-containing protein [Akkermansiaceae bacterium]